METRIKQVRKKSKISQREFAKRIGIGDTAISRIENGSNNPSDRTIMLICREFGVNEEWLRTGNGAPEIETDDSIISQIVEEYNLDSLDRSIMESYIALPPEYRAGVKAFIRRVVDMVQSGETDPDAIMNARLDDVSAMLSPADIPDDEIIAGIEAALEERDQKGSDMHA